MLLLDNNGYIIGFDLKEDDKPAPLPIDGARWDGNKWNYPEYDKTLLSPREEPRVKTETEINAGLFQGMVQDIIRPSCGTFVKEKSKKISVLITSYEKSLWVEDAINSSLEQSMPPYKIIVLSMTEEDFVSASRVESQLVSVVKSERLDASSARNKLVEICPTEYFIFLDADDMLAPNYIESVYKSPASIVSTLFKENWEKRLCWQMTRYSAVISNMTGLLNKECWNEVGGLRPDLSKGGEDSYFWNEIFRQKKWLVDLNTDTYLDYRKVDDSSLTARYDENILSKEKEMFLHYDWYKKCLDLSFEPKSAALLEAYNDFLDKYGDGNKTGKPLVVKIPKYNLENIQEKIICKKWNAALNLFKESMHRDTDCVCFDKTVPFLYGRKFDLFVYAHPALDWERSNGVSGMDEQSCYINNPNIDLTKPTEDLLKNFCVVFGSEHAIVGGKNPPYSEIKKDVEKETEIILEEMRQKNWSLSSNIYTFCFFSKCNKNCPYCSQKGLDANFDEDILYENFCEMVDKLELLHKGHWRPQIMGGEITLCSEKFAKRIMERVKDYPVLIVTNGHKYNEHILYSYPNATAYVHLTEPPFDDSFLRPYDTSDIVVNKADLPAILEAVEKGTVRKTCDFSLYVGNDKRFLLDEKEIKTLDEALEKNGYPVMGARISGDVNICLSKAYLVRQANVYNKTIVPCCGRMEKPIPISDWNCQPPSGKACKGCTITAYK